MVKVMSVLSSGSIAGRRSVPGFYPIDSSALEPPSRIATTAGDVPAGVLHWTSRQQWARLLAMDSFFPAHTPWQRVR